MFSMSSFARCGFTRISSSAIVDLGKSCGGQWLEAGYDDGGCSMTRTLSSTETILLEVKCEQRGFSTLASIVGLDLKV